jgi:hypothetical protein
VVTAAAKLRAVVAVHRQRLQRVRDVVTVRCGWRILIEDVYFGALPADGVEPFRVAESSRRNFSAARSSRCSSTRSRCCTILPASEFCESFSITTCGEYLTE